MGRSVGLCFLLIFGLTTGSKASITLQVGDTVTFNGQAVGASEGLGGAFNWQVASVVPSPASSPVGTPFQTFCDEAQQEIDAGKTYTITSNITPTLGQVINSSGNVLNDFKGLYLFDEWTAGMMSQTAANAAAVQIAVWESEGYNLTANNYSLLHTAGYSQSQYTSSESLITYWLGQSLPGGATYTTSWISTDVSSIELLCGNVGAQDQLIVYPNHIPGNSPPAPEPVSLIIWGVGVSLVGLAKMRRVRPRHG